MITLEMMYLTPACWIELFCENGRGGGKRQRVVWKRERETVYHGELGNLLNILLAHYSTGRWSSASLLEEVRPAGAIHRCAISERPYQRRRGCGEQDVR